MAAGMVWEWIVYIDEDADLSMLDFSDRVMGIQITQNIELNTLATFNAQITLNNDDGALTPGGGGTYTGFDWLAAACYVQFNITGWTPATVAWAAAGIINNFELDDDRVNSVVVLTVVDVWSIGARANYAQVPSISSQAAVDYISNVATWTSFGGYWPLFGNGSATITANDESLETPPEIRTQSTLSSRTFASLINNTVLPSINAWMWPTIIDASGGGLGTADFEASLVANAISDYTTIFTFIESADKEDLPFHRMRQGWTFDKTINTATVKSGATGAVEQTATNVNSATSYGSRTVRFTETAAKTDAAALTVAQALTNRYGTPRFIPVEVTTSLEMIEARCDLGVRDVLYNLMDVRKFFLRKAVMTWTGANTATQQTVDLITLGRTIRYTPQGGTTISVRFGHWADNTPWIIGQSKFGETRLG